MHCNSMHCYTVHGRSRCWRIHNTTKWLIKNNTPSQTILRFNANKCPKWNSMPIHAYDYTLRWCIKIAMSKWKSNWQSDHWAITPISYACILDHLYCITPTREKNPPIATNMHLQSRTVHFALNAFCSVEWKIQLCLSHTHIHMPPLWLWN